MSNIVDQPEHYFRQFIPKREELLIELEAEAEREDIPITGPVVGELLCILACAAKARRILELGTATGYSAIFLAKACEMFIEELTLRSWVHTEDNKRKTLQVVRYRRIW